MKVIGITGGIGSGKSQVLHYLELMYGVSVCQADQIARNQQRKGTNCYREIVGSFGESVLTNEGKLNRIKLAEIVFSDEEKRLRLNQIVHPTVKKKIQEYIKTERKKQTPIFIIEAALLLEEQYNAICDEIWYVYADETVRKRRLIQSRGYSEEKVDAIMKSQLSKEIFLKLSDRVIDNSHTFEETILQLEDIMNEINCRNQEKEHETL